MAFGGDGIEFNICDTIAPNIYFFANRSLDKLFKASDILAGSIEPTVVKHADIAFAPPTNDHN
jgi:hypothetical protein